MPPVRLVAQAQVIGDLSADLLTIDPHETALVSKPIQLRPGPRGDARLIDYRPGRIEVETNSAFERLLIVSERWSRGWRVHREGTVERPILAYGDFMSTVVPAGRHKIIFQFDPMSFKLGVWTTAAAVAILVGLGIVVLGRHPRYVYEKLMSLFTSDFGPVEYGDAGQIGIPGPSH